MFKKYLKYAIPTALLGFLFFAGKVAAESPNFWLLQNNYIQPLTSSWNLRLTNKSGADPTGALGGMYYNTGTNSFRCYNGSWQDCASATSTGSSISGTGTNGFVTRWTGTTALSTGILLDNATVAGVNATSSTVSFNVRGSGTLNPFNVSSSTGTSLLLVASNGSTTLSSLGTGVVRSASGSLFIGLASLTSDVSGILPVSNGGTGTNTLASLTVGTGLSISGGQSVLIGTSTSISLGTNVVTTLATGTSGNIFNGSISSNTLTLNLPFASGSATGQLQAADWTTFNNKLSSYNVVSSNGLITVSTTTSVATLTASSSPTFTGLNVTGTSTLATTTINGTLTVNSISNCNGTNFLQITSGIFGCGTPAGGGGGAGGGWSTSTPDIIYNSYGARVGINSTTPTANLTVVGKSGSTTPVFIAATSTGVAMLSVDYNNNILLQNEATPTFSAGTQKFFTVVGSQSGGVARIVRDMGLTPAINTFYGTYDITAYTATSTTGFPDGTGPVQTFSIATGTMQNILGDIGAGRSGADGTGQFLMRPYTNGVPSGGLFTLDGNTANGFGYLRGAPGSLNVLTVASSTDTTLFQINTVPNAATVYIQGSAGATTILYVASSSGTSYLTVASNGTTTLTSLGLGIVRSTSGGSLYSDNALASTTIGSFNLVGNGSSLTAGATTTALRLSYASTLKGWTLTGNSSCSASVDIWKSTSIPTSANRIVSGSMPALSSQQNNSSFNLSGWTTTFNAGDYVIVQASSTVTCVNLTLTLEGTR